jgi:DNA gyrase subunit A
MVVLDHGLPRLYGLGEILRCFIEHREEVVSRRTRFRLGKARDRAHILVGLGIAVANIDEVIKIIRGAPDPATAKEQLMARRWPSNAVDTLLDLLGEDNEGKTYQLSEIQAQAILDLRLHRLTGLERDKILAEAGEIAATIQGLLAILSDRAILMGVVKTELNEVKDQFATPRLTSIEDAPGEFNLEDLIQPEDVVVTISSDGYVKRVPLATFRAQRRGGKGKAAANLRENESMANLFVANTHDPVLFFTNLGNVFKLKIYEIPQANATSRGKAFVNLLPLAKEESVAAVVPLPRDESTWQGQFLLFATRGGMIRKTPLTAYSNVRSSGIYGMGLNEGDQLMSVHLLTRAEGASVLMSSQSGQAVRFDASEEELRPIASRTSIGVKGMNLRTEGKRKDEVMAMHVLASESHVLTVTENGYGKLTEAADYPQKGRGTMGVISIQTTDRNGHVVCAMPVSLEDQIMIATQNGQLIRMNVGDISVMGRNTQGVRLFATDGDKVKLVTRLSAAMLGKEEEGAEEDTPTTEPLPIEAPEEPAKKGKAKTE